MQSSRFSPSDYFFSRGIKLITLPRAEVEIKVMDEEGEKDTTTPLGTWPKVSRKRLFGSGGYLLASLVEPQPPRQILSKGGMSSVDFRVCSSMGGLRARTDEASRRALGKESSSALDPGTINTGSLQSTVIPHKHHASSMCFSSLYSLQAVSAESMSHHGDKDHVPPSICHLSGKALSTKGSKSYLPCLHYSRPDTMWIALPRLLVWNLKCHCISSKH